MRPISTESKNDALPFKVNFLNDFYFVIILE